MERVNYLIVLNVILQLFIGGGGGLYIGRNYGESCEEGETCHGGHVTCLVGGLCGCSSPDEMTFDPHSQNCKVNLGSTCDATGVIIECVQGASCNNGICRCDSGFYASSLGVCLTKKLHKEICKSDLECGRSPGGLPSHTLICYDGICQCDQRMSTYDPQHETCVGLVDSECKGHEGQGHPDVKEPDEKSGLCTANAQCKLSSEGKMRCECGAGYSKTSDGRCGKGYGHICGRPPGYEPCADIHFSCIDGNCTCKYPLHQIHDDHTGECRSLVSGPCTYSSKNTKDNLTIFPDLIRCVKNAECVDKGFYSNCECRSGFVETKSGFCSPGYSERCDPGDCDPDDINHLVCRNGVCECSDLLQVYDPSIKKCQGLVGSRCTTEDPECVDYATCVVPHPPLPGKCLCDRYSTEVVNRTCDYH